MNQPKTSKRLIKTQERRVLVMQLRRNGFRYADIVKAVKQKFKEDDLPNNYDERQAYQDVKRELEKLNRANQEAVAEIKQIQLERLDELLTAIYQTAKAGGIKEIETVLKIEEKRSKLCGTDSPEQHEFTGKDGKSLDINITINDD